MTERHTGGESRQGVDLAQTDTAWCSPELRDLGHLRSFVQTGGSKTGPCCEGAGGGSGEECRKPTGGGGCGGLPACGSPPCVP